MFVSSSSTTTSPPQIPGKRTRDQPNFSDCHCCGHRIIHSNTKDRLLPLDSFWRIVLLCRKCRRSVCSGQTCPYCFQVTGNLDDFCTCRVCQRKIHKDCVRGFGRFTPWCYLRGWFEGFKVCVDCWVPELLKNSVHVLGRVEVVGGGLREKGEGKNLSDGFDAPIWKGLSYKRSALGCSKDRKVWVCTNITEIGRVTHSVKNDSSIGFSGLSQRIIAYERNNKRKIWQLDNEKSETIESTSSQQAELKKFHSDEAGVRSSLMSGSDASEGFCIDGGRDGNELICYKRTKFKMKMCQLNGLVGESGDSSSCGNHGVAFKSGCCQSGCANLHTNSIINSESGNFLSGSFDREKDRFHLKYVKRSQGTKTDLSFLQRNGTLLSELQVSSPVVSCSDGVSVNGCELILPNGTCVPTTDRYSFKYSKRVNSLNPPLTKLHS